MKSIKDTVHGYISVPNIYFDKLIDDSVFQRLKRIEQTSIRTIFPCARHDRFIHSLGTFHLGQKAVDAIYENSDLNLNPDKLKALSETFKIACLLHDCGHSPFSHAFEDNYEIANDLDALILENSKMKNDYDSSGPSSHEKVSAFLVLTYYRDRILGINSDIDIDLVARMIIGCKYKKAASHKIQIQNCFILLNKVIYNSSIKLPLFYSILHNRGILPYNFWI